MSFRPTTHEQLQEYYGRILTGSKDLKTNACCCDAEAMPAAVRKIARKHIGTQTARFGYRKANVDFRQGYIEDLQELGLADNSVDAVISNCVINLSPDKPAVFREIFRVLKPGGELYFSDIFSSRRVPEPCKDDPVLHGECLGGAMYLEDFRRVLGALACPDYRVVSKSRVTIDNHGIEEKIGMVEFYSITVRAFKLHDLEDICEDYGQVAVYNGTIDGHPHWFDLDDHHRFLTGKPMLVCGNTASMLQHTRFAKHFRVSGDRSVHYPGRLSHGHATGQGLFLEPRRTEGGSTSTTP